MSELKAVFKVTNIATKVDKPIPFTNEVVKAGTPGNLHGKRLGRYIIRFSKNHIDWLYLELEASEIDIQGDFQGFLKECKPL
ncbi:hypothetical protein M7775_05715 [Sporomusa sphaeroides DSM 2875]|uniref:hypothetical protein n=1 Tax=Sporomusa sphaeroides TaxID=47679 RepID=UPI00203044A0|nr:hypothetical protein [Sporomusa sphaeroides]MCM0758073.1 hypothetical protein [Sporomusa sphaeroides DSM 2875]